MTAIPIERSSSLRDAEVAILGELDRLDLDYTVEIVGEYIHAARCTLRDKGSGRIVASGNGKGDPDTCRVGSLFEALEHLLSKYQKIDPTVLTYSDSLAFTNGNDLCNSLPLALFKYENGTNIPFLRYREVNGDKQYIYPLALSCPEYIDHQIENIHLKKSDTFDYRRVEQYSTNSGTAIGLNSDEAVIHGLLEGIERTSLSEFLCNTFLINRRSYIRCLDASTLPTRVRHILDMVKRESCRNVLIFEMPNKFGIPAYISWMEQYDFNIGIVGYGCSMSLEHAVLRSLYELGQYFGLSKSIFGFDWLRSKAVAIPRELEGLPLHQDCARFDMGWKCRTLGYELVDYRNLTALPVPTKTHDYLAALTTLIRAVDEVPYATELRTLENGITVMHTFITGEDRFFNVTNCKSTFPAKFADLLPN